MVNPVFLLAFKVILAPLLIATATLAGRRWGPGVSGWMAALPLTSGPLSLIFALQHGDEFAARAAVGTLAGLISVASYCVVYCLLARSRNWVVPIAAAVAVFFGVTLLLNQLPLSLLPTFVAVIATLTIALWVIPTPADAGEAVAPPRWDLPARMLTALVFVLVLSFAADHLGAQLSGLLSPFPIFATILAVFAHAQRGPSAAILSQRGILSGLYGFASFFLTVSALITILPLVPTYLAAVVVALAVNMVTLRFVRTPRAPAVNSNP